MISKPLWLLIIHMHLIAFHMIPMTKVMFKMNLLPSLDHSIYASELNNKWSLSITAVHCNHPLKQLAESLGKNESIATGTTNYCQEGNHCIVYPAAIQKLYVYS